MNLITMSGVLESQIDTAPRGAPIHRSGPRGFALRNPPREEPGPQMLCNLSGQRTGN